MSDETPQPTDPNRRALLFLCVANSARSQMAEGFARFLGPADLEVFSAGSEPGRLNPFAVKAMKEVGIDISTHRSKGVEAIPSERVLTVITLCAEEQCPAFPGPVHKLHWPLDDPAAAIGGDDNVLSEFRRVRDEIRELVSRLF